MTRNHADHFMRARIVAVFAVLVLSAGGMTWAKCGSGLPPDYDDIQAVLFSNGCGSTLGPRVVRSFECSNFYAFIDVGGRPQGWTRSPMSEFVQYNLPGAIGTYDLGLDMTQVRGVLRKDSFFTISPADRIAGDTAESTLSVRRCAVLTKVTIFDVRGYGDPASQKLFSDLRSLIKSSPKKLVSPKAQPFDMAGALDP